MQPGSLYYAGDGGTPTLIKQIKPGACSYAHILKQNIKVTRVSGSNDYSEPSYDPPYFTLARVDLVNKSTMSNTGEAITIKAKMLIPPNVPVDAGDKVEYDGINYRVEAYVGTPGAGGKIEATTLECTEWR